MCNGNHWTIHSPHKIIISSKKIIQLLCWCLSWQACAVHGTTCSTQTGNNAFVSGCTITHIHIKRVIKRPQCRVQNGQFFFYQSLHYNTVISLLKSVIPAKHQYPKLKQTLSSNFLLVIYTTQHFIDKGQLMKIFYPEALIFISSY